jgi:hypothetical protein
MLPLPGRNITSSSPAPPRGALRFYRLNKKGRRLISISASQMTPRSRFASHSGRTESALERLSAGSRFCATLCSREW